MSAPITEHLRHQYGFMKTTAVIVLVAFISLALQPLAIAANLSDMGAPPAKSLSHEERLAKTLEALKARLDKFEQKLDKKEDAGKEKEELTTARKDLDSLLAQTLANFVQIGGELKGKNLPPIILKRHEEAVTTYLQEMAMLKANLGELDQAQDDEGRKLKVKKVRDHLAAKQKKRAHTPNDPNKLPVRTPDGKVRKPKLTEQEYKASLFPQHIQVASTILTGDMLMAAAVAAATPADLAPTEDVQITDAIRAKAAELGHNPVKIYNFVRNNTKFIPTFGSIQGSDLVLQGGQGNAFDTASLLIALLRASNIPARYVYGTVQIPVDQVMNWVGGVTVPEAAQQLLGQGGIPNVGLIQGGKITHVRLEHVWVEAWVDFYPSRGMIHKQGDSWIPMDASFKQYLFTQGMRVTEEVPVPAAQIAQQLQSGAEINEAQGWVRGLSASVLGTHLTAYDSAVNSFVASKNANATVGDVIGTQSIIPRPATAPLAAALPYKIVAVGQRFAEIPSQLRHLFQFQLFASDFDRVFDAPMASLQRSLPALAGKRIMVVFVPATEADAQTIRSFLPAPHADGTPVTANEFPSSLPGYLIRLVPQLRVNGEIVAQGSAVTMGNELVSTTGLFAPDRGWNFSDNRPIAGETIAIGLDLQGISAGQVQASQSALASMKAKIESSAFGDLTGESLVGGLLHGAILAYFAAVDSHMHMHSRTSGVIEYRLPSYGTVSTSVDPVFSFGIPRQVRFPGVMVDVDLIHSSAVAKDNNHSTFVAYNSLSGVYSSALEHRIPERLFGNAQGTSEGVSAVKALAVASAQGQRIYTINSANAAVTLPQLLISSDVIQEIQNAVAAGREAVVSQNNVTVGGWTGVGYIITDPATGAGAYKISGGASGGELLIAGIAVLALAGIAFLAAAAPGLALISFALLPYLLLSLALHLILFSLLEGYDGTDWGQFVSQLGLITAMFMAVLRTLLPLILVNPALAGIIGLIALVLIIAFFAVRTLMVRNELYPRQRSWA